MAAAPDSSAAAPAARDAESLPGGGAWAAAAREAARERVRGSGMPGRRDEYWRRTPPDALTRREAEAARRFEADEAAVFGAVDCLKIVFADGAFDEAASDSLEGAGVAVERLADAALRDAHWAAGLYGALEARGQDPVARPLAALNTALAPDGVLIRVSGRVERPVSLVYRRDSETSDAILHHAVLLEPGAALTLLESGTAAARFNGAMEVEVGDGAEFRHVRAQGRDHERRAVTHVFARLGRGCVFKSFTLAANGALTRNECVVELAGEESLAHVAGASVGDGAFLNDDTVFVTHSAANCESRQVFKKVLKNGAVGVFQGKILVRPEAQKTDGYQISQSLLDGDSEFFAKPELEIYADDVACSHGSTSGAIDEDALFYLRARGVPRDIAAGMLTLAFLEEALEEIDDADLRAEIADRLAGWLERHRD